MRPRRHCLPDMENINSGLTESGVCENNAHFKIWVVSYPAPRISMLVARCKRSRRPNLKHGRLFRRRLHSRCSHAPSTLNLGAGGAHKCQIFAMGVIFADTGTRPRVFSPPQRTPYSPGTRALRMKRKGTFAHVDAPIVSR